jgi:IS30 family transposase
MRKEYTQLTQSERQEIASAHVRGWSSRAIGRLLRRAHSTVLREIHRHTLAQERYRAEVAHTRALRRRRQARCPRKLAAPALFQVVIAALARGWSPETIAGRLSLKTNAALSRGPIYQLLREQPALPHRSGPARRTRGPQYERIHDRTFLDQRSAAADNRTEGGHWEGDTLGSPQARAAVLATATCRKHRYTVLAKVPDRSSAGWRAAMVPRLRSLRCKSLTVDNGMEFASHRDLAAALKAPVYFAHPGCPWERGTNEYHNGLLRWGIPKGTDVSTLTAAQIQRFEQALNDRPRKQLGWLTPAESLAAERAHLPAPRGGQAGSAPNPTPATPTL